jgi:hypothetical protein
MAWTTSKVFAAFLLNALDRGVAYDLDTDTPKVALYDNDITPNAEAAIANIAYNVDQWTAASNEVTDGTAWPAGGRPLAGHDVTASTNVVKYDATDTASNGTGTLTANYGCLVYDDTVTGDYGLCFNYFGGVQQVTGGTFTIVWHTNGIFTITV